MTLPERRSYEVVNNVGVFVCSAAGRRKRHRLCRREFCFGESRRRFGGGDGGVVGTTARDDDHQKRVFERFF